MHPDIAYASYTEAAQVQKSSRQPRNGTAGGANSP